MRRMEATPLEEVPNVGRVMYLLLFIVFWVAIAGVLAFAGYNHYEMARVHSDTETLLDCLDLRDEGYLGDARVRERCEVAFIDAHMREAERKVENLREKAERVLE